MAKGLRSSVKKSNRTKLRSRVFQPVEDARLERLHQKLLETAQQPKPEPQKKNDMEVDSAEDTAANEAGKQDEFPKEMEVDGATASKPKQKNRKAMQKARKIRGRKPKNQLSFPTTRGKGALKPFSESRIRKKR